MQETKAMCSWLQRRSFLQAAEYKHETRYEEICLEACSQFRTLGKPFSLKGMRCFPLNPASADGDDHISLSRHLAAIPAPARKWSDNYRSVVLRQVPLLNVLLNTSPLCILPQAFCTNRATSISFTKDAYQQHKQLMEIGRCNVWRLRRVELQRVRKFEQASSRKKKFLQVITVVICNRDIPLMGSFLAIFFFR